MMTMMVMVVMNLSDQINYCDVQIYDITTLAVLYIAPNVAFGSGEVNHDLVTDCLFVGLVTLI